MVTLVEYANKNHLAEIFQALDIKFSFLKEGKEAFEQVTNPGKCRDFLGDVLWSKKWGKQAYIWGFKYNYNDAPFDDDALKLSLKFPHAQALENFKNNLAYVHEKETKAGIKVPTKFLETQEKDTLVVIADPIWQKTPWRLSLYTFYLKVASYKTVQNLEAPECYYMEKLTAENEETFLSHVMDDEDPFFYRDINHNHEQAGFISTIKGYNGQESTRLFGGK